ncbi:MAG: hypothetical protein IJK64_11625 [Clostridia bacterium]|nr:hypothetical protein [Clostridia bacterium]
MDKMFCPHCGKEIEALAFCPHYGAKLATTAEPTETEALPAEETTTQASEAPAPVEGPAPVEAPTPAPETEAAATPEEAAAPEAPAQQRPTPEQIAAPAPSAPPAGNPVPTYSYPAYHQPDADRQNKKRKRLFAGIGVIIGFLVLIFVISSAHKNALPDNEKAAVNELVSKIDALPNQISVDDEKTILSLSQVYSGMNEDQQKKVKNYKKLEKAGASLNSAKIKKVEDAIAAIGTVTLDSGELIKKATSAYQGLPDELKDQVRSYAALTQAQSDYNKLCANKVSGLIDGLGEITLSSETKLNEIKKEYAALSEDSKKLVTNYSKYEAAVKKLNELEAAEKKRLKEERLKKFKAALSGFRAHKDDIKGYTWYYPTSFPEYIDTRCYFLPYICTDSKTGEFVALRIKADYTGSSWLFWKKLTINIDGENHYITANYFDVERDNAHGDVWEYYDFSGTIYVDLLRDIAKSKKTIVRFEGDQYYKDVEISAADKDGIKKILAAYDAYNADSI